MIETARIIEVFSSVQGEGIHVGQWHLFVRFWDCNLSCHYCDTDYRGPYREVSLEDLTGEVEAHIQKEGPHHAVSLTGGEPLLWWQFLKNWLPSLKALGQKSYLETNGTLAGPLKELLPWIDVIAMDLKPSSATGDRFVWKEHEAFLRAALQGKDGVPPELFIKIVVTSQTEDEELQAGFRLVSRVDSRIPVVLQPVTPMNSSQERPELEQLNRWRRLGKEYLREVRILPQLHPILGVP